MNDRYTISLKFVKASDVPDKIQVEELTPDSDEYESAKDAVTELKKKEDKEFDEETLGMAALDIKLLRDGEEYEPQGAVTVSIEMKEVPEGAEDVEVQHITDGKKGSVATTVADTGKETEGKVSVGKKSVTADFSVESFSVFTFSWIRLAAAVGNALDVTDYITNAEIYYVMTVNGERQTVRVDNNTVIPDTVKNFEINVDYEGILLQNLKNNCYSSSVNYIIELHFEILKLIKRCKHASNDAIYECIMSIQHTACLCHRRIQN